jgi:competence ComEA-like helix-hairpin-helix protein
MFSEEFDQTRVTYECKKMVLEDYPELLELYKKNGKVIQGEIIKKLETLPSESDGRGWVYGYRLEGDLKLRTNFKVKLGRTGRPDPYNRIKEQGGIMEFCTSSNWNRKFERLIHLFFSYARFTRGKQREWFHFREWINVEKIVSQIKELMELKMEKLVDNALNVEVKNSKDKREISEVKDQPVTSKNRNLYTYTNGIKLPKININTASKKELMTLSGVGDVISDMIIIYRESKKFEKIEDIMKVKYIKEGRFEVIKDRLTV